MQTLADKAWTWTFFSPEELRSALEEYSEYVMAQGAPPDQGDPDPTKIDRGYRIWAQNKVIDRGMRDLIRTDRIAWYVLDLHYCQGYWGEFRGWVIAARAAQIPVPKCMGGRCQVQGDDRRYLVTCGAGKNCDDYRRVFEECLTGSIAKLFAAIDERQERTIDNHQRTQ